jgi:N-acetylglucosaminyldiphosphoundecaprenol N-acetyl-beta-D-mannosaminyltransferase
LVFGLKWLYGIEQDKVSGPDLMPSLLAEAEKQQLRVFFYGATQTVLNQLIEYCQQKYPDLKIAGAISPPFRVLNKAEEIADINAINRSKANLVFVALGCPKQEIWMSRMKGEIQAVMLGVGGAFPMLVGVEKRAPKWMQENGLEWFFRLAQDPKRLFKRYLVTNSWFIYLLMKEKLLGTKQS